MAPTAPSKARAGVADHRAPAAGRSRTTLPTARTLALAMAAALSVGAVRAQQWRLESSVGSNLTWTSNSLLGVDVAKPDVLIEVSPRLAIRGEGSRLRVAGSAELTSINYVKGTRSSRLLPTADVTARYEAVDDFLFIDSGVRVVQEIENAFGAQSLAGGAGETRNTTQLRIAPRIESAIGPGLRYSLRSENLRTREARAALAVDTPSGSGYFGRHSASITRDPAPLGWHVEAERTDTRYYDSLQPTLVLDVARAGVDYAITSDLSAGVHAGVERNSFFRVDRLRTIYGVDLNWRPSERTRLSAFGEQRYFGPGWRIEFDHRSPFLAWTLFLSRGTESAPQGQLELPATDNVAALLDTLFTTRFPNPADRAKQVQLFMAQQGLPTSTTRPTNLFSQRLSLATSARGSVALIGSRSSALLGLYYARVVDAPEAGDLATGRIINNNIQRGVDLTLTHRMTPTISASMAFDLSRIQAVASVAGDRTTQAGVRASVRLRLAAATAATFGGSVRKLASNVTPPGNQVSVFAGLEHGF
jgi:uncharacterized protein (PEP-CTERM system associated)